MAGRAHTARDYLLKLRVVIPNVHRSSMFPLLWYHRYHRLGVR